MAKLLIIAEKPSVARDIASALGGFSRTQEWLESPIAIVTSAVGHLVELHVPEAAVKGAPLPVIPAQFGLQPIERTKDQFTLIKKLMARQDVATVVNACDAGREGELIFRLIYDHAGSRKPIKRMWLQSMTADAIREAHRDMRPGAEFDCLAAAARSRAEADWLVGINGSRAVSRQRGEACSAGRVQTPTLALIVDRHQEILNFVPKDYFEVHGTFGVQTGKYLGKWQNPAPVQGEPTERIDSQAAAQSIVVATQGQPVQSVRQETKPVQKAAPRLYDLTTLQREANKRFGLSAKQTLDIAQALYERHKVLTYPRTDSNALPEDYIAAATKTMNELSYGAFEPHAQRVMDSGWIKPTKKIFDNSKITDHFAIIPTGTRPTGLDDAESKIFDMVTRRFIAAFHPAAEYQATTRITIVAQHTFKSTGRVLTQPGWLAVYGQDPDQDSDGDDKEPALCVYTQGEVVRNERIELKALKTKPPKPFTEAMLLGAMENAGKLVDDEEMAAAMKDRGLGTPATRAATIEGLLSDNGGKREPYLRRDKKNLIPTEKAVQLITFLRANGIEALTSPALTGDWEAKLRQVEAGKLSRGAFMSAIEEMTRNIVTSVMKHAGSEQPTEPLQCKCPKCGAGVAMNSRTVDCAAACGFRMWREIAKRPMQASEIEQLLTTGLAGPFDGFTSSKTGNAFSAGLRLTDEHKAEFVFTDAPRGTSGPKLPYACPNCKKHELVGSPKAVQCGCGFRLWTTIAGKTLTEGQVATLITKGTVAAKGFKSSAGKPFDASLTLDAATGKVNFDFGSKR